MSMVAQYPPPPVTMTRTRWTLPGRRPVKVSRRVTIPTRPWLDRRCRDDARDVEKHKDRQRPPSKRLPMKVALPSMETSYAVLFTGCLACTSLLLLQPQAGKIVDKGYKPFRSVCHILGYGNIVA